MLLYPSPDAVTLNAGDGDDDDHHDHHDDYHDHLDYDNDVPPLQAPPRPPPVTLLALDGTWLQARYLYRWNTRLHTLPKVGPIATLSSCHPVILSLSRSRCHPVIITWTTTRTPPPPTEQVQLAPKSVSLYRQLKRAPSASCLSTVEAVGYAVEALRRAPRRASMGTPPTSTPPPTTPPATTPTPTPTPLCRCERGERAPAMLSQLLAPLQRIIDIQKSFEVGASTGGGAGGARSDSSTTKSGGSTRSGGSRNGSAWRSSKRRSRSSAAVVEAVEVVEERTIVPR